MVILCAIVSGPPASAQERYVREVRIQLQAIESKLEDAGFERTHDYKIDRLPDDGKDRFSVTLRRGTDYILASVCDSDCSDLDVNVFDENGNEVAKDTTVDDHPMVSLTPRWTGRFTIRITMYRCSDRTCYYGIGVFGRE